ncbi:MAG TPA: response regulator transcription factor [Dehalococcoidales bacterium]
MANAEHSEKGNVLIVSDDNEVITKLVPALHSSGYVCSLATCADEALSALSSLPHDVILIDLSIENGYGLAKSIREKYPHAVIITISTPETISSAAGTLESGADDYLLKPIVIPEALARIECVLLKHKQIEKAIVCKTIKGELMIDCKARRASLAGKDIRLTDTEFRLLWELVRNKGKAITYGELLARVWGTDYQEEKDYLYTYVRSLRLKIESEPDNPQHIINIPRVGYRFDCL